MVRKKPRMPIIYPETEWLLANNLVPEVFHYCINTLGMSEREAALCSTLADKILRSDEESSKEFGDLLISIVNACKKRREQNKLKKHPKKQFKNIIGGEKHGL